MSITTQDFLIKQPAQTHRYSTRQCWPAIDTEGKRSPTLSGLVEEAFWGRGQVSRGLSDSREVTPSARGSFNLGAPTHPWAALLSWWGEVRALGVLRSQVTLLCIQG